MTLFYESYFQVFRRGHDTDLSVLVNGRDNMILQKKYSVYFYCSCILVLLYGVFALMVLIRSDWNLIIQPDDFFGAALGRRVLISRVLAIVLAYCSIVTILFSHKLFSRSLLFIVIWSWASYIDDTIIFQQGLLEVTQIAGGYLVMFRPFYLLLITYILVENWARYGEHYK